jgi:three-Cys-motif partner protein
MYVRPTPEHPTPGGAAYIDLFAGPGRSKIDTNGDVIDGSPLVAASHEKAPFTKLILCDLEPENIAALESRLAPHRDRVTLIGGSCIENIDRVVQAIPPYGLNLALVDPFGPKCLRWSILEKLGQMKRMDLLIHFPTGAIKRNLQHEPDFDEMVGTADWRKDVHSVHDVHKLVMHLRRSLERLGYTGKHVREIPIKNSKGTIMYHLVSATKRPLGDDIWSSVVKMDARGQRNLFDV